ncbi:helix-turn-helix domain-containing protein [Ornithinibacillus xuwenensis]|uniref:Helix-turn-helix transcriptional regulator n=1 Tax=Ornithinibacillus xuwenensis TaxID=3144668 RepID=A0ABU9XGF1_9BACI
MNNIGFKIKYYRTKLGMTQSELASGIISASYLSKIENGNTEADPEVIGLLCKRLNISPHLTEFESDTEICQSWFKTLLDGNREKATQQFDELTTSASVFSNDSLVNLIDINKLRYYILINEKFRASRQLAVLERRSKKFELREEYYWTKFKGEYYFSIFAYGEALQLFQAAERLNANNLFFKEQEEADLSYLMALAASKMRQTHLALFHASKSLNYYQSTYNLYKCAQCHILLGIAYRRIEDLENAKQSYEMARTIAKSISNTTILSQCNQNMGALYASIGEPPKAIEYFIASYESRIGQEPLKLLVPISSLMKEYYKVEDFPNARLWLNKGLEITKSIHEEESIHVLEFKVYQELLSNENSPALEQIILNEVFPFLDKKNLFYLKQIYQETLANYYYRIRKYKSAADYYIKANQTLTTIYNK